MSRLIGGMISLILSLVVTGYVRNCRIKPGSGALQRKKFNKSEVTMEMGGWVQVSIGFFF